MTKSSKISETNEITYYCTLHRTIKNSQEYYDNNKKKKINLCDSKIIYNKNIDKFYLANNHSLKCEEFMKQKFENNKDINIDDKLNNNSIIEIKGDWRQLLNNNIPNLLIYIKQ